MFYVLSFKFYRSCNRGFSFRPGLCTDPAWAAGYQLSYNPISAPLTVRAPCNAV